ncbi:MAG: general secretion pathway protein GspB [Burkholderiales bacterium]|nr:general secretion pathway protein GspB [Burkholderiales bacterium]
MSYILDALRKADSERERGSLPSIHAQAVPPVLADEPPTRGVQPLVWVIVALSVLLIGSLAWHLLGSEAGQESSGGVLPAPPVPGPAAAPRPMVGVQPPPATPSPVVKAVPTPMPMPIPMAVPTTVPEPARAPVGRKPSPVTPPAVAPPEAPQSASDARVADFKELPEDLRRSMPTLTIGGAMYSDSPTNRLLIINGQVFHEGDKPTPDLALEQIKLKSAVLRYKGRRFSVTY